MGRLAGIADEEFNVIDPCQGGLAVFGSGQIRLGSRLHSSGLDWASCMAASLRRMGRPPQRTARPPPAARVGIGCLGSGTVR